MPVIVYRGRRGKAGLRVEGGCQILLELKVDNLSTRGMISKLLIIVGLLSDKSPDPADGLPIVQKIRHAVLVEYCGAMMSFN